MTAGLAGGGPDPGYWYAYPEPIYYDYGPPPPDYVGLPTQPTWYYCDSAKAYFPYVGTCPVGWRTVPATPVQASGVPNEASAPASPPAASDKSWIEALKNLSEASGADAPPLPMKGKTRTGRLIQCLLARVPSEDRLPIDPSSQLPSTITHFFCIFSNPAPLERLPCPSRFFCVPLCAV